MNEDFKALRDQVTTIVTNAKFNGVDLIDGSLTHGVQALASADGKNHITVNAETMSLTAIGLSLAASIGTQTSAASQITKVDSALQTVNSQLARLGTGSKKIDIHKTFVAQLSRCPSRPVSETWWMRTSHKPVPSCNRCKSSSSSAFRRSRSPTRRRRCS